MPRAEAQERSHRRRWFTAARALLLLAALLPAARTAMASGPRWVTGPPYFTGSSGQPVVWFTTQPRYFTDPGDLSASVNHAAADAMVAAAAGVWNVPTSAMVLAYGGALDEQVSGANTYLGATGLVFPADVQSGNFAAKQIAVIYDRDGSITDLLLGGEASSPAECRQNAVTESVDAITSDGNIEHAILVLNGRCTGPAPEQQLQMQYQLERAFGRVFGIGWSQTNDNVFTGTPQPTSQQALHWPIMHPIDIVCGPYTYQCMPQPFTLRADDIAAITGLYPEAVLWSWPTSPPAPGKIWSYEQASQVYGTVTFPTGEGMQGVNVVIRRQQGGWSIPEPWYETSSVSGYAYRRNSGNVVTGADSSLTGSMGSPDAGLEGYYRLIWIPDIDPEGAQNGAMTGVVTTEPINPLYVGAYAVGPYTAGQVTPSGAAQTEVTAYPLDAYIDPWNAVETDFAPSDASSNCSVGGDGTESAPQPVAAEGWWTGVLCAYGHTAWTSLAALAGRTATLEVTALDDSGAATTAKAMPLLGVWAASDATGTLPTVAATPSAFNSIALGMTAAYIATTQPESFRFVIADARGDGRPDFAYRARVLYAAMVQPAVTSVNGGQITISGMGFHAGNTVTVNGVPALVSSWTAKSMVAVAPPQSAFRTLPSAPVDVAVTDLSTGGSTVMTGVLTYGGVAPDGIALVSSPSGTAAVGTPLPFAVRMTLGDGVTPVVGLPVTFTVTAGSAQWGTCPTASCVVLTDATGLASISITATAFGNVSMQAAAVGALQTAGFQAIARSVTAVQPVEYVAPGATVVWTPQVTVIENGAPDTGATVSWASAAGMTLSPATSVANSLGLAQAGAIAGPLAADSQATGLACVWTTVCANLTAVTVDPSEWKLVVVSGAGQSVTLAGTFAPVVLRVTDVSGNPVAGAPVAVHQTVDAAEMPCPAHGPCPVAPELSASTGAAVSDADGLISVTPMQIAGAAEVTNLAVAAGTQGFVSLSLKQGP